MKVKKQVDRRFTEEYIKIAENFLYNKEHEILKKYPNLEILHLDLFITELKAFSISKSTSTHLPLENDSKIILRVDYHDYNFDEKPTKEEFLEKITQELSRVLRAY